MRKKPRPRTRKPGAQTDYEDARDELRRHGPRARWALDELERMARGQTEYGRLSPALTILCLKEILAYEGLPKALEFKAAEGVVGDTKIEISVQGWAAGPGAQRRIEAPVAAIAAVAANERDSDPEERAHAGLSSVPSPAIRDAAAIDAQHSDSYAVYEVQDGEAVLASTINATPARPADDDDEYETVTDGYNGFSMRVRKRFNPDGSRRY